MVCGPGWEKVLMGFLVNLTPWDESTALDSRVVNGILCFFLTFAACFCSYHQSPFRCQRVLALHKVLPWGPS
jgi:hypothetical protein